jgi:phage tail protein X
MKTYTTKSGDTWDLIAFQKLGNCKYTAQLMDVNRDKLSYTVFPAGVALNLPEIEQETTKLKLPAWRL